MSLTDRSTQATHREPPVAATEPPPQARVVVLGLLGALVLGGVINARSGQVPTILFALGLALGFVLFHSRFGFTSAWRQLVAVRQGKALRAHMLMLAVACTLFAPILANGVGFHDVPATPTLAPIGWGLFVGSFMFGVGMQLGGSCASGTLFAIGSGHTAILLTLAGFIGGATLGAYQFPWWMGLPSHEPVSLTDWFGGYAGAWVASLVIMGLVVGATYLLARKRSIPPLEPAPIARGVARAIRGSWPLWVGAILLAVLNAATLWVSGGAWGVTFAFALWGSKILDLVGVDVLSWGFWQDPANLAKYDAGILAEKTSVMDFGIILGALVASAAAGAFVLHRRVPFRLGVGAVVGGLLMGYGARIAFGCNIGAYFGGIASFSLHGWLWGVMAIVGTYVGLLLRPLLGLRNPKPSDSVC
ncbi:YeeE/YedE family protein [Nocardioides sp. MAH-18]|uniref:YeeE/YedE family protein n=1 Tax=Nocardioides agri TaxID=2682843 RepID=A0A6L6XLZ5_9ACTN|nr:MULTISPECIES: YeeE/YedE family protein [unclassified Nocardioides]MBA2953423.1 YeeE/YedE family protein [Nocardioides sp. CGMCC 1.13656]MVQ48291.1 YeeE/YedE family protein [Nocardioides sp. MAH-18]